jgi:hypothetical protein
MRMLSPHEPAEVLFPRKGMGLWEPERTADHLDGIGPEGRYNQPGTGVPGRVSRKSSPEGTTQREFYANYFPRPLLPLPDIA